MTAPDAEPQLDFYYSARATTALLEAIAAAGRPCPMLQALIDNPSTISGKPFQFYGPAGAPEPSSSFGDLVHVGTGRLSDVITSQQRQSLKAPAAR